MSLQEFYEKPGSVAAHRKCKVCDWYNSIEDADRAFFDAKAVGNIEALADAITDSGFSVAPSTLRRHIRRCN